jgi:uncharacterized protein YaaN involved in tellurite resistance
MSKSLNSQQKIDGFKAISGDLSLFMVNLNETSKKLKADADVIAVPGISNVATGILSVIKGANDLCVETSESMVQIVKTWGERQGFGAQAQAAFEDCQSTVAAVANNTFTVPEVDACDGLHENVSDETVAAFQKDIQEVMDTRYDFIMKVAAARDEYATEDTAEVYNNIGAGIERFTNGIVEVLESQKATLQKFNINLDESIEKAKTQAAGIVASGDAAKSKIGDVEGDLN